MRIVYMLRNVYLYTPFNIFSWKWVINMWRYCEWEDFNHSKYEQNIAC